VYTPVELRGVRWDEEEVLEGDIFGEAPGMRGVAAAVATSGESERGAPDRRAVNPRLKVERVQERPKLPAVPLVQGLGRMLLTIEVIARWGVLSAAMLAAGWFIAWVFSAMSGGVFLAIPMFAIGCVLTGLWLIAALPFFLTIVTESSEGNDRLHDPPTWLSMDFAEPFFVAIAASVSAIPAWLSFKIPTTWPWEWHMALAAGAWLFCFPIVLLSNLAQSSAFAVFSPRLVSSLVRRPVPWLLFYIESAMLAAAAGAAAYGIAKGPPWLVYLAPWLVVGTLIFYMRLIGRLAWWLAETMPAATAEPA
jgi:hypothetical protein